MSPQKFVPPNIGPIVWFVWPNNLNHLKFELAKKIKNERKRFNHLSIGVPYQNVVGNNQNAISQRGAKRRSREREREREREEGEEAKEERPLVICHRLTIPRRS